MAIHGWHRRLSNAQHSGANSGLTGVSSFGFGGRVSWWSGDMLKKLSGQFRGEFQGESVNMVRNWYKLLITDIIKLRSHEIWAITVYKRYTKTMFFSPLFLGTTFSARNQRPCRCVGPRDERTQVQHHWALGISRGIPVMITGILPKDWTNRRPTATNSNIKKGIYNTTCTGQKKSSVYQMLDDSAT